MKKNIMICTAVVIGVGIGGIALVKNTQTSVPTETRQERLERRYGKNAQINKVYNEEATDKLQEIETISEAMVNSLYHNQGVENEKTLNDAGLYSVVDNIKFLDYSIMYLQQEYIYSEIWNDKYIHLYECDKDLKNIFDLYYNVIHQYGSWDYANQEEKNEVTKYILDAHEQLQIYKGDNDND